MTLQVVALAFVLALVVTFAKQRFLRPPAPSNRRDSRTFALIVITIAVLMNLAIGANMIVHQQDVVLGAMFVLVASVFAAYLVRMIMT